MSSGGRHDARRARTSASSGSDEIAAWLYRPGGADGAARVPCVVMAHGFSGRAGIAFRPTPSASRTPVSPFCCSTIAASATARESRGRSSTSAASTPTTGCDRRPRAGSTESIRRASRCSAPRSAAGTSSPRPRAIRRSRPPSPRCHADGLVQPRVTPPKVAWRATLDAIRDQVGAWRGREPVMIAPTGPPGSYAVMTAPEADRLPGDDRREDSRWMNRVAARIMLHVGTYRPIAKGGYVAARCSCRSAITTRRRRPSRRCGSRSERRTVELLRYRRVISTPTSGDVRALRHRSGRVPSARPRTRATTVTA